MKKIIYFLFIGPLLYAQVGIGTTTPDTMLDVVTGNNSYGLQHSNRIIKLRTFLGGRGSNGFSNAAWLGTQSDHPLDFMTNSEFRMRIDNKGFVGICTPYPNRVLEIEASNTPIRISHLEKISGIGGNTDILTIDKQGDIRSLPLNNMLAGPSSLTCVTSDYVATGSEAVIWNCGKNIKVILPVPEDNQIGKSITIVASGGNVVLEGAIPTVTTSVHLEIIPKGKRITIFGIAKNVLGNSKNDWCIISKDF